MTAKLNCFPPGAGSLGILRSDTNDLRELRMRSDLQSRSFHRSCLWAPVSKSMRNDTEASRYVSCMRVRTTRFLDAPRARADERTHSKTVVFSKPFLLKGVDRILPAGDYRV